MAKKKSKLNSPNDIIGDAVELAMANVRRHAMKLYPDATDLLMCSSVRAALRARLEAVPVDDLFDAAEALNVGDFVTASCYSGTVPYVRAS